jgi:hypothetical protein
MKTIILSACMIFAFGMSVSAQQTPIIKEKYNANEKIQPEPPIPPQESIDRAARQADVNAQNNKSVREAEDQLTKEKERSTGKEDINPAETNPRTVKPPVISDPVSAPVKKP